MEVHNYICDGCGTKHEVKLEKHTNGRGEIVDLCDNCVRIIILKALKSEVFILRSHCSYCQGKGTVFCFGRGWIPCGYCCY